MDSTDRPLSAEDCKVLVEVTRQLLAERCVPDNHTYRRCFFHAEHGNLHNLRIHLSIAGVDPTRIDAILPLLHG